MRPTVHGAPTPGIKTWGGEEETKPGMALRKGAALLSNLCLACCAQGRLGSPPPSLLGLGERSGGGEGFAFERPARFLIQLPPNLGVMVGIKRDPIREIPGEP